MPEFVFRFISTFLHDTFLFIEPARGSFCFTLAFAACTSFRPTGTLTVFGHFRPSKQSSSSDVHSLKRVATCTSYLMVSMIEHCHITSVCSSLFSLAGMMALGFLRFCHNVDDEVQQSRNVCFFRPIIITLVQQQRGSGHRSALNLLTRSVYAMFYRPNHFLIYPMGQNNPIDPEIVESGAVMEQQQEQANLHSIPIPHHCSEDRGRHVCWCHYRR